MFLELGGHKLKILRAITRPLLIGTVVHLAVTGYVIDNLLGGQVPMVLGMTWMRFSEVTLGLERMTCHFRAHARNAPGHPSPPPHTPSHPADLKDYCASILYLQSTCSPPLKQHVQYALQCQKQIRKALNWRPPTD